MEEQTFFDRLMIFASHHGYTSMRSFAMKGLGYTYLSKLTRLKYEDCSPGYSFLQDIVRAFPNADINWLMTGTPTNGDFMRALKECWKQDDLFEAKKIVEEALKDHFYYNEI